jgi:hypothetical protein
VSPSRQQAANERPWGECTASGAGRFSAIPEVGSNYKSDSQDRRNAPYRRTHGGPGFIHCVHRPSGKSRSSGNSFQTVCEWSPWIALVRMRDPGRPVFGEKPEHRDRLAAAWVAALDRDLSAEALAKTEADAPDRPARAPDGPLTRASVICSPISADTRPSTS